MRDKFFGFVLFFVPLSKINVMNIIYPVNDIELFHLLKKKFGEEETNAIIGYVQKKVEDEVLKVKHDLVTRSDFKHGETKMMWFIGLAFTITLGFSTLQSTLLSSNFTSRMEEQTQSFDRRMQEQTQSFDKRMQEQTQYFDKRMEEQSKRMDKLEQRIDKLEGKIDLILEKLNSRK